MIKFDRKRLILLFLGFSMLLNEVLFFLLLGLGVLPKYVWFDVCIILLCLGVVVALPNYLSKSIFVWFVVAIQFLLNLANIVIVNATNEIFSLDMLFLAGEGLQAFDISFINVPKVLCMFIFLAIEIIVFILITRSKDKTQIYKKYNLPLVLVMIFAFQGLGAGGYALQKLTLESVSKSEKYYMFQSDKYLYENLSSKWECIQRFGTGGFYLQNVMRLINGRTVSKDQINQTANYFASGVQTKSDVFGISKDNNVITILLESLEKFGIDPYFTPNLYNLFYKDGIMLTRFYANNRTNISEGLTLAGNYPRENPINMANKKVLSVLQNEYEDFTLAKKLDALNYKTMYVHNNVGWFYNRDKTHNEKGFGYQEMLCLEDMDRLPKWVDFDDDPSNEYYKWYNWTLDSDVMSAYADYMYPKDTKFYTHFSTISSHGAYKERKQMKHYYDQLLLTKDVENGEYEKMWEYLYSIGYVKPESEKYLEMFHWYKSQVMDLDKAIGILFEYLKEENLLNNTTLLLFADHNAYYDGLTYIMKDLEYSVNQSNTKLYNIPVVIYDKELKNYLFNANSDWLYDNEIMFSDNNRVYIDKFSTTYNLLPTLMDLLGLEYNPNFYMNTTVFTNKNYLKIFQPNIGGTPYFNDKVYISFDRVKWQSEDCTERDLNQAKLDTLELYYKYLHIERMYEHPEILEKYSTLRNK